MLLTGMILVGNGISMTTPITFHIFTANLKITFMNVIQYPFYFDLVHTGYIPSAAPPTACSPTSVSQVHLKHQWTITWTHHTGEHSRGRGMCPLFAGPDGYGLGRGGKGGERGMEKVVCWWRGRVIAGGCGVWDGRKAGGSLLCGKGNGQGGRVRNEQICGNG